MYRLKDVRSCETTATKTEQERCSRRATRVSSREKRDNERTKDYTVAYDDYCLAR